MSDNLDTILTTCRENEAMLVAVSKTKPISEILSVYDKGQRDFGENRVPELVEKQSEMPNDIQWHMIGHLQRNKVSQIVPFVGLIHSVESVRLINQIEKDAMKINRKINCLLQIKIAEEETKYGFEMEHLLNYLSTGEWRRLQNVNFSGVMGMASFVDDEDQVRSEFVQLHSFFDTLKKEFFSDYPEFKEISMGMSGDYRIALQEGSTMVRIGSLIFGAR